MKNERVTEVKKSLELSYDRVSIFRRISAGIFDMVLSLITTFLLLFATFNILPQIPSISEAITLREEISLRSGLYIIDDEEEYQTYADYVDDLDLSYDEKSALLDECLKAFFSDEDFVTDGEIIYLEFKTESTTEDGERIFDDEGERILINDDYDEDYYYFYVSVFSTATGYLFDSPVYSEESRFLTISYITAIIVTFLVPTFFFYCLVPLIFRRNRQTLGMKIVKIALVDADGFSVKTGKYWGRAFFFFLVEIVLSLFSFLIPLLLSLGMLVMMKSHQTLHDYVFNTYCVNLDRGKIYLDYQEYKDASINRESRMSLEDEKYQPSIKK